MRSETKKRLLDHRDLLRRRTEREREHEQRLKIWKEYKLKHPERYLHNDEFRI